MGAIVYGVAHGEYSDYRVAALFESEEKAKAWIRERKKCVPCSTCNGTGKLVTGDDGGTMVDLDYGDDFGWQAESVDRWVLLSEVLDEIGDPA